MNIAAIIGLVLLAGLVGLVVVMLLGGIVAFGMGGRRPSASTPQPAPINPFFTQFESALQTVNANARVKAQQYDLAQQQALYDLVMTHDTK